MATASTPSNAAWQQLEQDLSGSVHRDLTTRQLYSTDASVYQELPTAVALPMDESDLQQLVQFAATYRLGLIPRTAGTSLAGQVVGAGIVVDLSRHWTQIVEIDPDERTARVQPGVIRDELNLALAEYGLLFGPETSTANRAMMGGMLGNNSCGSNSVVYGSTRDHVLEVRGVLNDGSIATFSGLDRESLIQLCASSDSSRFHQIHRETLDLLHPDRVRQQIQERFPKPEIHRRNTGYAVDRLIDCDTFDLQSSRPFDLCQLLAGSEGTLMLVTEIKLRCLPLPPPVSGLQCAHFKTVDEALQATLTAMKFGPYAVELMDDLIIAGARRNRQQRANVDHFVRGNPGAILVTEIRGPSEAEVRDTTDRLEQALRQQNLGHDFPVLFGEDTQRVWQVRKAGLGVVANIPGDEKPVAVVEDTAVALADLPAYIRDFNRILDADFGRECVHYAHAGSGEIHLRPVLNLKTTSGQRDFRRIAERIAELVTAYRGSLSGEHGDGRLRGEFLESMIGPENYQVLRRIKQIWDPDNLFNPGKIVDAPPMDTALRYTADRPTVERSTVFDFSAEQGIQRAAELCSGSGDCRKTHLAGGTMCPSYMATRNERDSTRARANLLRHLLTNAPPDSQPLADPALLDIMDLCLSCKGCQRECPSNVDVGKLKAEVQQAHHDVHGVPFRSKRIAQFVDQMKWASRVPGLYNRLTGNRWTGSLIKRLIGFSTQRTLPRLAPQTFRHWFVSHRPHANAGRQGKVILFADEFTQYNDVAVGIAAVELIERLGFEVQLPDHVESGRAAISKGLLRRARSLIEENVRLLEPLVDENVPLIGIEPSAILTFRDEAPHLVQSQWRPAAQRLAQDTRMLDEWIAELIERDLVSDQMFVEQQRTIRLHGHCHQKALASLKPTVQMLQLPRGYRVRLIPSGCCGMAGSFGYEAEHYDLSMEIGELVLFPAVRAEPQDSLIAAPGTSCRHQILDGTGRTARHPIEILRNAWRESD